MDAALAAVAAGAETTAAVAGAVATMAAGTAVVGAAVVAVTAGAPLAAGVAVGATGFGALLLGGGQLRSFDVRSSSFSPSARWSPGIWPIYTFQYRSSCSFTAWGNCSQFGSAPRATVPRKVSSATNEQAERITTRLLPRR